ncbi:MAG TPA: DNA polymerase/3'-5' exonuclease PolX [Gaiellaceae bacterium]|nr:DNA polymerase/3'-5' exonuclease PolX [Gaiellaceae bacterium]
MADLPNNAIAVLFDELADLYELDGASIHRVFAYRGAAKTIREAPRSIAALTRDGKVTELPGIGKTLEEKLVALVTTGHIPALEKLRARFPSGLVDMTRLPGLGPKKARRLFDELGVDSLEALRTAAEQQRLRDLKGFGPKFELSVIAALDAGLGVAAPERVLLSKALPLAEGIRDALRAHPAAARVELAGSARRLTDTVKDLDIIAAATDAPALLRAFCELELVEAGGEPGENAARARTHTGMSIDFRVVAPDQLGNLLQHLTGSKMHNVALRERAVRRGINVSEYGLVKDGTTHRCATEEEVYALLGLPWIPPELREDRGELQLEEVPRLVELEDLRGDLHMHTTASDGRGTIEDMALAARDRGYEYLCITDHSATHGFGNHVTPDEMLRQVERVREADAAIDGIRVLVGTETNILPDGSPDYEDGVLEQLDWVVGSVHTAFNMTRETMTKRMVAAIEHPLVRAIGHPTGRKLGRREGYAVDVDALIEAAARTGTCLEINGAPDRRDLDDVMARAAAEAGVPIVLDSDAHGPETLRNVRWAVATARRAWITPDQVANTRPWAALAR